jgi:hypothetical protein
VMFKECPECGSSVSMTIYWALNVLLSTVLPFYPSENWVAVISPWPPAHSETGTELWFEP